MLKLSDESRGRILALRRGPGYDDLLDIGEKLCQIAETELLQMDRSKGATAEGILSKQDQCRGFRLFYELLQMEIEMQTKALVEGQVARAFAENHPLVHVNGEQVLEEAADILGLLPEMEVQN